MNKKTLVVAAVASTLAMGTAGAANASTVKTTKVSVRTVTQTVGTNQNFVNPIASVLASLVSNGTITAAQSTAITNALAAARPTAPKPPAGGAPSAGQGFGGPRGGFGGAMGGIAQQEQSVILSTLGITAATLQSDLAAGKSLATIAGTQTQALINALVAAETTAINAQVTAGKLTQAQATTMISGLSARITAQVNRTPGQGFGGHGFGHNGAAPTTGSNPSN